MPQISPMKWLILNLLAQSSILQMNSFLSMKKNYTLKPYPSYLMVKKLCWKW